MYIIAKDAGVKLEDACWQVRSNRTRYSHVSDGTLTEWEATAGLFAAAQTIIFPADVLRGLGKKGIAKFSDYPIAEYHLPFEIVFIQFDHSIPEKELLIGDAANASLQRRQPELFGGPDDVIEGVLLAEYEDDAEARRFHAIVWYKSGAVNRVLWSEHHSDPVFFVRTGEKAQISKDKYTIQQMAYAIVSFINAENVELDYTRQADAATNAKRKRQGKKVLHPFYTCIIRHTHTPAQAPTGTPQRHHGFMYAVRAHARHLKSGKVVWVHAHYRGLAHAGEGPRPKIYRERGPAKEK